QPCRIERRPEQRTLANENQVAAGQVPAEVASTDNGLYLTGLEGQNVDVGVVEVGDDTVRSEEDGLASRQNLRPPVRPGASVAGFGQRLGRPSGFGNARQARSVIECCDDVSVFTPTATAARGSAAQRERCAALHRNLLQLATSEISDPLAIGGKERVDGAFGSREHRRVGLA